MIYPPFLHQGDTIGITAPSAGISEESAADYLLALKNIKKAGFKVTETASVRNGGVVSNTGKERAAEVRQLAADDDVKMILCASGGDFLIDMTPHMDFEVFKTHPKWVQGYSDPTGLLFPITTNCDIATIYGPNAGGFGMLPMHVSLKNNMSFWRGKNPTQYSFPMYQEGFGGDSTGYKLTEPVNWNAVNGPVEMEGRCIGGCMECLVDLIGTKYDNTVNFIEKYKEDGIVWYFDIFSLRAELVYNALWHMREAGWFKYAKGFIFGRVCFPSTMMDMTYEAAIVRALGNELPIITQADIGHVHPSMTMINGALTQIRSSGGKGEIRFSFE